MSAETGKLVGGRYRIVRKIAEGGMGAVFEAQHNLSKKTVALKILFPHIGKDEGSRQRFLREVSAPAQIGHEGIVEVYDAGFDTEDGSLFVAMELLEGEPLRDRLIKGGISLDRMLDIFEETLDPLAAAHASHFVHRDLKPENVFVQVKKGKEIIKILDFGIARELDPANTNVTHTGIAMGTPHYMAPEQAMSAKGVTASADVWALGVMLYEALAGRTPFDGETASAIVVAACTQQHPPLLQVAPHVPPPLAQFVDRCLSKDPKFRPQDAGQMLQELRQVRAQIGSVSGVASAGVRGGMATGVPMTGGPFTGQPSAFGT
ncbi:MAG: serine/threonine protein kinase, partial [Sandaracinaceae bacterium]|nr:serine/threonine protein kinase [Sandaracinaceae bacterium]